MNRMMYDLSMLAGVVAAGVGVGLRQGVPDALIVVGALIICLTLVATLVAGKR
jgi:hypothetical protein